MIDFIELMTQHKLSMLDLCKKIVEEAVQAAYEDGYKEGYCDAHYDDETIYIRDAE